jgi:hypothetical protein
MTATLQKVKNFLQSVGFKKYARRFSYYILGCMGILLLACGALSLYFNQNKTEIIAKINTKINENINGKFHIGDFQYKFLTGFPNFTLALKDVELKDNQWNTHKHTLLKANEIEIRLNVWSLLQKEINIHKILINDADIYLYKAENGYSNADIFKPKKKKTPENNSKPETTINQIDLNKVHFILDNHIGHKLFNFDVASLKSKVNYNDDNWHTDLFLDTQINSLAFILPNKNDSKELLLFLILLKSKKSMSKPKTLKLEQMLLILLLFLMLEKTIPFSESILGLLFYGRTPTIYCPETSVLS